MIPNTTAELTLDLNARDLANCNAEMAGEPAPYISDEECAAYAAAEDMEALALAPACDLTDEDIEALCIRDAVEAAIAEMACARIMSDAFAAIDRIEKVSRRAAADARAKCKKLSVARARAAREADF